MTALFIRHVPAWLNNKRPSLSVPPAQVVGRTSGRFGNWNSYGNNRSTIFHSAFLSSQAAMPHHRKHSSLLQIRVGGPKNFATIMATSAKEAHDRKFVEK